MAFGTELNLDLETNFHEVQNPWIYLQNLRRWEQQRQST
jgi:hypothetical protein